MASLLIVSLRRLGSRSFTAQCQWPRLHPLNERSVAVSHHPLIMAESTRQLALALERGYLSAAGLAPLQPVTASLGLRPWSQPTEHGSATEVTARVNVSDLARYAGPLAAFRVTAEYQHAGVPFGSCTMQVARPVPLGTGATVAEPLPSLMHPPAAAVGAAADTDVLLARAPQGRLVIVPRDPRHPILLAGRPAQLPVLALLEAVRQAALLSSGMTAAGVAGLSVAVHAPVPACGALVEVASEPAGSRVLITAAGRIAAVGTVSILTPRSDA
ncbi:AfsA-related hotdog domain-containing protein [Streptomyces sp. NPDC002853]